jgi:plastocyanin
VRFALAAVACLLVPTNASAATPPCKGLRNVAKPGKGKRCRAASLAASRAPVPMTRFTVIAPVDPAAPDVEAPAGDAAGGDGTAAPSVLPARLGVVAREWSLTLSKATLTAGPAKVELQNFGEDAHNLRIERTDRTGTPLDVPETEAGERTTATGTLRAGEYKVYCALPGHDAAGMHARLVVR